MSEFSPSEVSEMDRLRMALGITGEEPQEDSHPPVNALVEEGDGEDE
jgi:hypothetical protein